MSLAESDRLVALKASRGWAIISRRFGRLMSNASVHGFSMNMAFGIWSGLLGLVALVWASRHLALSRNQRSEKPLSSGTSVKLPTPAPKVSMLVAAKDEEANIEACVTSMLAQDYPALEVFAVNDRSTDRTPEILERIISKNGIPYTPRHNTGKRQHNS